MKRILLACGTGICTSTTAAKRLEKALNDRELTGKFTIEQCNLTDAAAKSAHFDLCVATEPVSGELQCPVILGAPALLTGIGLTPIMQKVMETLEL